MTEILIIANPVELEHLSYADPRPLLGEAGFFDTRLVAAGDIAGIQSALGEVRLIILASNSLKERRLRDALVEELQPAWTAALERGCSLMVLHQLGLTQASEPVPGLPEGLGVTPVIRPRTEMASAGWLEPTALGTRHPAALLPTGVDFPLLNERARGSGPGGLYWHYWEPANPELWRVLVTDRDAPTRSLLMEHRLDRGTGRVIVSSIPLDWIRSQQLLPNLVSVCLTGDLDVAVLDDTDSSLAMSHVLQAVSDRGHSAYVYSANDDRERARLAASLNAQMHRSLLVSGDVQGDSYADIQGAVSRRVDEGTLRVLKMPRFGEPPVVSLTSKERRSSDLLEESIARLRIELAQGMAEGSIWSTVDSLTALSRFYPESVQTVHLGRAVQAAQIRVIADSYDETFVPTAAFAWLRSRVDDAAGPSTGRVLRWLEQARPKQDAADHLRAAALLLRAGLLPQDWKTSVAKTLSDGTSGLSELETLTRVECAMLTEHPELDRYVDTILESLDSPVWEIAGCRADLILALLEYLESHPSDDDTAAVYRAVSSLVARMRSRRPLSGETLGTTIKYAVALAAYDDSIGLPTDAVVDALVQDHGAVRDRQRLVDTMQFAEFARRKVSDLEDEVQSLQVELRAVRRNSLWIRPVLSMTLLAACGLAILLAGSLTGTRVGGAAMWDSLAASKDFYLTLFLAVTTGLAGWTVKGWRDSR